MVQIRFWTNAFLAFMAVLFTVAIGRELWQISSKAFVLGLALLGAIEMIRDRFRPVIQGIHDRISRSNPSAV